VSHRPTELSGGEQQRVAIARALMNDPSCCWQMSDGQSGYQSGQELIAILERLNTEQGLTLVIVTHDPTISSRARRIIRLRDGMLVGDERQGPAAATS